MFIDASAIVAILTRESDAALLEARIARTLKSGTSRIFSSPVAVYEAATGIARALRVTPSEAETSVASFLATAQAELMPITAAIGNEALSAFERYGKGRHAAALNMGDCFAYACAKHLGVPLLCKGEDFRKTDVRLA